MENTRDELIKVDRNGSKHWNGKIQCDRCGGHGYYAIGIHNGKPVLSPLDAGVCWKCGGNGWVIGKWIERTPEYQAKLDAKREAKRAAEQARLDAERAERERIEAERRAAEEARIKAEKAVSQYVGTVGEKVTCEVTYIGSPYYERRSFSGYGTETCYVHTFKDENGNKLIWNSTSGVHLEENATVTLTGTVKEHKEYKDEKQTYLIRCKVTEKKGA